MKTKLIIPLFGELLNSDTYKTLSPHPIEPFRPEYTKCAELYKELLEKTKPHIDFIAKLEEVMTQIRCQEFAFNEIKLSEVRGYIYARAPFYILGSNKKDIRVTVGKTDEYGSDLNVLLSNDHFVKEAKKKLVGQMALIIEKNLMEIEEIIEENKVII